MLIEFTLRGSVVAALATVTLDVERSEQTRSEWTVASVASIVRRGVEFMRTMNSSWLGFDTNVV